jgi:hypothetical protein
MGLTRRSAALLGGARDGKGVGRDTMPSVGKHQMKKIALIAVAAGLMSVAACHQTAQEKAADNVSDNMEMQADNLQDMADNATGAQAAALTNASENMEDQADAVENGVENTSM